MMEPASPLAVGGIAVSVAVVTTAVLLIGINHLQIQAIESGNIDLFAWSRWTGYAISLVLMVSAMFFADIVLGINGLAAAAFGIVAIGPTVYFTSRATGPVAAWTDARECFMFYEDREEHWTDGWEEWLTSERPYEDAE